MELILGDVDNDGRDDLLIPEIYGEVSLGLLRVAFAQPDGSYTEPRFLNPRDDFGSINIAIYVRDFDGDGRNEILWCRGAWNHFSLAIYRIGPDRQLPARPVAHMHSAPRTVSLIDGPDGRPVILVAADARPGHARFFAIRRIERPFLGVFALRFDGQRFVDAGLDRLSSGPDRGFAHMSGPYELGDGRYALVVGLPGPFRWLIYDGPLPDRKVVATVPLNTPIWRGQGRWICDRGGHWCRPLTDDDLAAIARRPLLLLESTTGSPTVGMARFLLDVGLPGAAAEHAAQGMEREADREVAFELTRLRMRGLLASGRVDELLDMLDGIEPVEDLAPSVLDALSSLLERHGAYARVARIAGRWSQGGDLSTIRRQEFDSAHDRWRAIARRHNRARVDVQGRTVHVDGEPHDLADVIVASRPGLIHLEPDDDGQPTWLVGSATRPDTCWIERSLARDDDDGWTGATGRQISTVGVPVRFNGDYLRVTVDLRAESGCSHSFFQIGIHTLRGFPANGRVDSSGAGDGWSQGLRVRVGTGGQNDRYANEIGFVGTRDGQITVDAIRDRWLRIDLEYVAESGFARLIVADPATGEVLHHAWTHDVPPPGGALGVLGVRSLAPVGNPASNQIYRLRRIVAAGEVEFVPPDDPDLQPLLHRTSAASTTEATRAWLRGDGASADAILRQLADRFDATAAAETDPALATGLRHRAMELRLDAALRGAPDRLTDDVVRLFREPGTAGLAFAWLMAQPYGTRLTALAWQRVGQAWARLITNGAADAAAAVRADLVQRVRANQLRLEDVVVVPWLVQRFPDDPNVALAGMAALATGWSARGGNQSLPLTHRDVLGRFLLEMARQHEDLLIEQPPLLRIYLMVLARELDRDEVLRLAPHAPDDDSTADLVQLVRDLRAEAAAELARARRQVVRSPVPFPEYPTGSGRDD